MRHFVPWGILFFACALAGVAPAAAQEASAETDPWLVSGGFDLIELMEKRHSLDPKQARQKDELAAKERDLMKHMDELKSKKYE